jgi:hypothetical protein
MILITLYLASPRAILDKLIVSRCKPVVLGEIRIRVYNRPDVQNGAEDGKHGILNECWAHWWVEDASEVAD